MNYYVNNEKKLEIRIPENYAEEIEETDIDLLIAKIEKQSELLQSEVAECEEAFSNLETGFRQLHEKDLAIIEIDKQIRTEREANRENLKKAREFLGNDTEELQEGQIEDDPSSMELKVLEKQERQQAIAKEIEELNSVIDLSIGSNSKSRESVDQPQYWPSFLISVKALGQFIQSSFKFSPPTLSPSLNELDQLIHFLSQNQSLLQNIKGKLQLRDISSLRDKFLEAERCYRMAPEIEKESGRIILCKAELALFDSVLEGIIELMRNNQILIRKQSGNRAKTVQLKKKISKLDHLFNIYFLKYEELYKQTHAQASSPNFQDTLFTRRLEDVFKDILTTFFKSHTEPKTHLYNKRLADLAYSMDDEIVKYYSKVKKLSGDEWSKAIIEQFNEFLKWAKTHPKRASYMMGDIVCAYLNFKEDNSNLIDECANIAKSLKAIMFTQAYLDALGKDVDQPDDESELRFKALVDLVSIVKKCGIGYKIGKRVFNSVKKGESPLWGFLEAIAIEGGKNVIQETAAKFISEVNPVYTSLLLNIIQGKGISDILAEQRNLALIKFAGGISKFEWKHLQMGLEIWIKAVREAKWDEKRDRLLYQFLLPVGGTMVGVALIIAELSGYIFLLGASFSIAVLITSGSIVASYLITRCYINKNSVFQATYDKAREAIQEIWNNKLREDFFKKIEHKKIVVDETKRYLEELKKRDVLFFSPFQKDLSIESKYRTLISDKSREFKEKLEKEFELALNELEGLHLPLSQKSLKQISIPVAVFSKTVSLNNLRNEIKSAVKTSLIENEKEGCVDYSANRFHMSDLDKILFSIYDELISSWLEAKVGVAFEKQIVNCYTSGVANVNGKINEEKFKEQIRAHIQHEAGLSSDAEAAEIKEAVSFYERRYIINTRMSNKST
ncbi:MAG: hypothetical protein ACHQUC_00895 [Chlamydiales bacterium]